MSLYRISGVWKNSDDIITHYAFHTVDKDSISRAEKKTKSEAIRIVEKTGNKVTTWVWNYTWAIWNIGGEVHVVNGKNGKYLRSNPDTTVTYNLGHLIDYDWIVS